VHDQHLHRGDQLHIQQSHHTIRRWSLHIQCLIRIIGDRMFQITDMFSMYEIYCKRPAFQDTLGICCERSLVRNCECLDTSDHRHCTSCHVLGIGPTQTNMDSVIFIMVTGKNLQYETICSIGSSLYRVYDGQNDRHTYYCVKHGDSAYSNTRRMFFFVVGVD